MNPEIVYIIKIKNRYFYGFGKNNRVLTAYYLAGAKLIPEEASTKSIETLIRLNILKIKYDIVKLGTL